MEVIYNVFSEERYHHFRHVVGLQSILAGPAPEMQDGSEEQSSVGDGVWPTGRRGGLLLPGPSVRHPGLQMEAFWVSSEEISNPHGR